MNAITSDDSGRIYAAGLNQDIIFDLDEQYDAVVACYDTNASQWAWLRILDESLAASLGILTVSSHESLTSIALDGKGGVVVAGTTTGELDEACPARRG